MQKISHRKCLELLNKDTFDRLKVSEVRELLAWYIGKVEDLRNISVYNKNISSISIHNLFES